MSMRTNLVLSFLIVSLPTGLASDTGAVFPHTAFGSSFMNDAMRKLEEPASATNILSDIDNKVMKFIKERDNNDTSTATRFLDTLKKLSSKTEALHTEVNAPDTAWDSCLLAENTSLHAWRVCRDDLQTLKDIASTECAEMVAEGVGSFTIDTYAGGAPSYKLDGFATPALTCNFESFTIDGTDIPCSNFLADIANSALEEFKTDMASYNGEKEECRTAKENDQAKIKECKQKFNVYYAKEEECDKKETTLINKICTFERKLVDKCTTLGLLNTELTDLESLEEDRNKEFRAVMRLKCLFTRYTNNTDKCFDTAADKACDWAIDGASKDYGSKAAQELHEFRTKRKTHNTAGGFQCAVNSLTFGDNVRYEKKDKIDFSFDKIDYSYYVTVEVQTYITTNAGVLSPAVCS